MGHIVPQILLGIRALYTAFDTQSVSDNNLLWQSNCALCYPIYYQSIVVLGHSHQMGIPGCVTTVNK